MGYTKEEIKDWAKKADYIEVFQYADHTRRLHTDFINFISMDEGERALDRLPYDEDGCADVDIEIMDGEDYDMTILANGCVSSDDIMEEGETVAVIVVRDWTLRYNEDKGIWEK